MGSNTRFLAIALGSMLAICCSFQLLRGQAAPATAGETDHYQLDTTDTELYVVDTTTGHIWSRAIKSKGNKWIDEGGPHGG